MRLERVPPLRHSRNYLQAPQHRGVEKQAENVAVKWIGGHQPPKHLGLFSSPNRTTWSKKML
jgi:hypothetical protein